MADWNNDWNRGRRDNDWNRGRGNDWDWNRGHDRDRDDWWDNDWNWNKRYGKKYRKYNHYYGRNDAWWYPYWNQWFAPVVNPILSAFWPYPVTGGFNQPYYPQVPPIYYP